jgi:uncharacterized protein (TIGR03067 family)
MATQPVPSMKVRIEGKTWSFLYEQDGTWQPRISYEISLDDSHNPPHIDLSRGNIAPGRVVTSAAVRGIYAVEGNTVKILYNASRVRKGAAMTTDRPASFSSPPEGAFLFILTREK